jgi:hypothetical protein
MRRRLACLQHGLVEGQHEHLVELCQRQRPAVVQLHELLHGQLVAVDEPPEPRQLALVIEEQAVFLAAGDHVQGVAHAPQELLTVYDSVASVSVRKRCSVSSFTCASRNAGAPASR